MERRASGDPMRLAIVLALPLVLASAPARASCQRGSTLCFCSAPARYGVVVTESIAGARATVRVERAGAGLTAGQLVDLPRAAEEAVGHRWLLRDTLRQAIDAEDTVGCIERGVPRSPRLPIETVMAALASPSTCDDDLEAAGFALPCNDVRSCSLAPAGLVPLAVLAWLLRRRRTRSELAWLVSSPRARRPGRARPCA